MKLFFLYIICIFIVIHLRNILCSSAHFLFDEPPLHLPTTPFFFLQFSIASERKETKIALIIHSQDLIDKIFTFSVLYLLCPFKLWLRQKKTASYIIFLFTKTCKMFLKNYIKLFTRQNYRWKFLKIYIQG